MGFSCECEDVGENGREKRTRGSGGICVGTFYSCEPSAFASPSADLVFLCSLTGGGPLGSVTSRFPHRGLSSDDSFCISSMTSSAECVVPTVTVGSSVY